MSRFSDTIDLQPAADLSALLRLLIAWTIESATPSPFAAFDVRFEVFDLAGREHRAHAPYAPAATWSARSSASVFARDLVR